MRYPHSGPGPAGSRGHRSTTVPHGLRRPTAPEAERQASRLPAFQAADSAHVDLFAAANVRLWDEITQLSISGWTGKMAQAAHAWAAYRQARQAANGEALGAAGFPSQVLPASPRPGRQLVR